MVAVRSRLLTSAGTSAGGPFGPVEGRRHPGEEGDAERLLVGIDLVEEDAVLAEQVAVVRGDEDRGVVEVALLAELADDLGDAVIDGGQRGVRAAPAELEAFALAVAKAGTRADPVRLVGHVGLVERGRLWQRGVGPLAELAAVGDRQPTDAAGARPGGLRRVRGHVGEHQKERTGIGLRLADEVERLVVHDPGRVAGLALALDHGRAVVAERGAVVDRGRPDVAEPVVEPGRRREAAVGLPVAAERGGAVVVEEVAADMPGAVAGACSQG